MVAAKYHGKHRREVIDNIERFDIIITTYNTLAKEHAGKWGQGHRSLLHNFAWYRVVLDEGQSDN